MLLTPMMILLYKATSAAMQKAEVHAYVRLLPLSDCTLSHVQVLAIDGNVVDEGWNGDRAAQFLRGTSGTSVRVRLARRSAGKVPGVASRPEVPLPVPTLLPILLIPPHCPETAEWPCWTWYTLDCCQTADS